EAPSDRVSASRSGLAPVTSVHPGLPPRGLLHAARRSGVSFAGSMLTEIRETAVWLPRSSCRRAKRAPINGQTVVQLVNTKLMATTRPWTRSEEKRTGRASWGWAGHVAG